MSRRTPTPAAPKVAVAPIAEPAVAPATVASAPDAPATVAAPVPDVPTDDGGPISGLIEVRVLSAFDGHDPNDVIEIDLADLSSLAELVDADPAAVDYAKALKA